MFDRKAFRMLARDFVHDSSSAVIGAIIHKDDLQVRIGLGTQRIEALADPKLFISRRHNNRKNRTGIGQRIRNTA